MEGWVAEETQSCIGVTREKVAIVKKRVNIFMKKMKRFPRIAWTTILKVGKEDSRRVIHSIKVGLSLTLVCLLYLLEPLFREIGEDAMWAVMTVVVVLEFTAGATLYKGLNRGLGTFSAGMLAFFIEYIGTETGHVFKAIFIGTAVFIVGAAATYLRFFPCIKKNYDYGVVIFLLTFNLIAVSSYRVENVLKIAHQRVYTIAIGCGICLIMSLFVFPNWSGEDLHKSTVSKLEGLAFSIEACVKEYFNEEEQKVRSDESQEDPVYESYMAVLDSKSADETLALHASWEPRHSRYCYKIPWKQYVKLGAALRHFGYTVVALHGCLKTEIQTPRSVRALFKDPCTRLAGEVSKALKELADSVRNHRQLSPAVLSDHLHESLHDLNEALRSQPKLFLNPNPPTILPKLTKQKPTGSINAGHSLPSVKTDTSALLEWKSKRVSEAKEGERKSLRPTLSKIAITTLEFSEALPFAAFASSLVEAVARLDLVIEEVEELGRLANFKEFKDGDHDVIVDCEKWKGGNQSSLANNLCPHGPAE